MPLINYKTLSQTEINKEYLLACEWCDFHIIKYLLTSSELKIHADINYKSVDCFRFLCEKNSTNEIIKYLFTSTELKNNLALELGQVLIACNNLDLIDFMLTNVHQAVDLGMCVNGKTSFTITDYLSQLPTIMFKKTPKEILELFYFKHGTEQFKNNVLRGLVKNERTEILEDWLITKNIEIPKMTKRHLLQEVKSPEIKKIFAMRELNDTLNKDLKHKPHKSSFKI